MIIKTNSQWYWFFGCHSYWLYRSACQIKRRKERWSLSAERDFVQTKLVSKWWSLKISNYVHLNTSLSGHYLSQKEGSHQGSAYGSLIRAQGVMNVTIWESEVTFPPCIQIPSNQARIFHRSAGGGWGGANSPQQTPSSSHLCSSVMFFPIMDRQRERNRPSWLPP